MTDIAPSLVSYTETSARNAGSLKLAIDPLAFNGPSREWPFTLTPLAGYAGASITGIDLRSTLPDSVRLALQEALGHYGVLFFRGQQFDPTHHSAFGRQFGTIKPPSVYMEALEVDPDICVISTENGRAYLTDRWHQDVSWPECPPRYSILHMQDIPTHGGDTMWSSLYLAYERLSATMREFLLPLTIRHAQPGAVDTMFFDHPLVIRHPISGRRALYTNPTFSYRLNELSEGESTALLAYLHSHATTPEFTCRWRWQTGDVAMWDNCYVMHYALGDYHPNYRKLHRIEIEGQPLLAAAH